MHAKIGLMDDTEDAFKFPAQEVDFTKFYLGATTFNASAALLASILYVYSFWKEDYAFTFKL